MRAWRAPQSDRQQCEQQGNQYTAQFIPLAPLVRQQCEQQGSQYTAQFIPMWPPLEDIYVHCRAATLPTVPCFCIVDTRSFGSTSRACGHLIPSNKRSFRHNSGVTLASKRG